MNNISAKSRRLAAAKTDDRCCYCGIHLFGEGTIEHILPKAKGGTNDLSNLAIACKSCNASKRDRTVEEFRDMCIERAQGHISSAIQAIADVKRFGVDHHQCVAFMQEMAELEIRLANIDVKFFFEVQGEAACEGDTK